MKKQEYVSPEMEVVEMKTQGFLAFSGETPGQSGETPPEGQFE